MEPTLPKAISDPPRRCNCKKTRCLKLYCECFLADRFCDQECGCVSCANCPETQHLRVQAQQSIIEKNPLAFQSFESKLDSQRQQRGCNCKKSLCVKRYCECFNNGVGCVESCKCTQCSNVYNGEGQPPQQAIRKKNIIIVNNIECYHPVQLLSKSTSVQYS